MHRQTFDCSEKFAEAWLSCMVFMVEGNLSALTVDHVISALKLSTSATLAYAALQLAFHRSNPFLNICLMGAITALMDFNIHPTHFGPVWAEAVATGGGTMLLGFLVRLLKGQNLWKNEGVLR